ncbi:MAG TPA: DNA-deoxyinosine glycosylase, partial [Telluria sp.]|nr:DNA-deoxyinosine glycosylase [Telluria sp.]
MSMSPDHPTRKRCFPPVVDGRTRLLVLGSLPGEKSLQAQQYYANPRNQFWALMSAILGADLVTLDYPARLEALLHHGVGLW